MTEIPDQPESPDPPKRRRSYLIGYLWFSSGLLSVLVIVAVLLVFQNRSGIRANHASNVQQCRAANITRVQDIAIWKEYLKDQPGLSPVAKARINHLIEAKDTPRDCTAAFSGG